MMTAERCAKIFQLYIKRERPGLERFFPGSNFGQYPTRGAEMIDSLVDDKCPSEMAEDFSVLVLYDLVILLGESRRLTGPAGKLLIVPFTRRQ